MIPDPVPGLVICYAYLWAAQQRAGLEEGRKDRPCAIVVARRLEEGDTVILVVPITHTEPSDGRAFLRLPDAAKRQLGLDADPSWICCDEMNRFVWPGADLRPVRRDTPYCFHYGVLPPALVRKMVARITEARLAGRLTVTPRTP